MSRASSVMLSLRLGSSTAASSPVKYPESHHTCSGEGSWHARPGTCIGLDTIRYSIDSQYGGIAFRRRQSSFHKNSRIAGVRRGEDDRELVDRIVEYFIEVEMLAEEGAIDGGPEPRRANLCQEISSGSLLGGAIPLEPPRVAGHRDRASTALQSLNLLVVERHLTFNKFT